MLIIRKTITVKVNNNKTPMTGLTIMIIKKKQKNFTNKIFAYTNILKLFKVLIKLL